jgi:hypothetical protein
MKKQILSNRDGLKIPHADMVALRQAGVINLGIENELSATIAGVTNIGPKKTTVVAAFQFWNWTAVGIFVGSIYWSFTKSWWWFIAGLIVMRVIWSANKKGNAENFLEAAILDNKFYDRVLAIDGWMYQFKEDDYESLKKYIDSGSNNDLIGEFSKLMKEIDVFTTFWDESTLPAKKHELQIEIIEEIKATDDEAIKEVFLSALIATCRFVPHLGEPVSSGYSNLISSDKPVEDLSENELMELARQATEKNFSENMKKYVDLAEKAKKEYEDLRIRYSI